jgi:hypothetical protein
MMVRVGITTPPGGRRQGIRTKLKIAPIPKTSDDNGMTRDKLLEVVAEYGDLLRSRGLYPEHIANMDEPFDVTRNREAFLRHLLWACERIPDVIDKLGGFLFCVRYLGCIQGGLAACGLLTVAQLRQHFGHFAFEREHYEGGHGV